LWRLISGDKCVDCMQKQSGMHAQGAVSRSLHALTGRLILRKEIRVSSLELADNSLVHHCARVIEHWTEYVHCRLCSTLIPSIL
jgi:hypothetical protein